MVLPGSTMQMEGRLVRGAQAPLQACEAIESQVTHPVATAALPQEVLRMLQASMEPA